MCFCSGQNDLEYTIGETDIILVAALIGLFKVVQVVTGHLSICCLQEIHKLSNF